MVIKFLGSGSAFVLAEENYQSNILITKNGKTLLYDAGTSLPESLNHFGLTPNDIDDVIISHIHADHCGGMEYLGFKRYFSTYPEVGNDLINLHGDPTVLIDLWNNTLRGGMQSLNGKSNKLNNFFNVNYKEKDFLFEGTEMKLVDITHVVDDHGHVPACGLKFTEDGVTVFITGDAQFRPDELMEHYEEADIIFQDSEMMEYPNSVHAQFHQLCTLPEDIKSKMWLYHYSLMGKHIWELEKEIIEEGFAGIVRRGQEFDLSLN